LSAADAPDVFGAALLVELARAGVLGECVLGKVALVVVALVEAALVDSATGSVGAGAAVVWADS
jgi:hypothetical protein